MSRKDHPSNIIPLRPGGAPPWCEWTDEELAAEYAAYKTDAPVEELMTRYYAPAWHFAEGLLRDRFLAEDAVQSTFVRVVRGIDRYDPQRSFATWFYSILRNLCRDAARGRTRHQRKLARLASEAPNTPAVPQVALASDVEEMLQGLDPEDKRILILRYIHGLDVAETADVLSISPEAAKKRAQRALKKVSQVLSPGSENRRMPG